MLLSGINLTTEINWAAASSLSSVIRSEIITGKKNPALFRGQDFKGKV
jgi:hypothetical protein